MGCTYVHIVIGALQIYHDDDDDCLFKQVNHLEPWEKGSRKTAGQTGMCGGVRIA